MPKLVVPRVEVAASAQTGSAQDSHEVYHAAAALTGEQLSSWVESLVADTREGAPRPAGYVPSTHLWWVQERTFIGRVQIRHRLTDLLREQGGHIGYFVAPEHRRRGHATAMLAAALPVAAAVGIECALLTCDATNVASRRTIEANGGLFADQRGDKLRYWVPTQARP